MAKLPGSGVAWSDVAAQYGSMKAGSVLAPADAPLLADASARASAAGGAK